MENLSKLQQLREEISMADKQKPSEGSPRRVESALKAVMEAELTRQRSSGVKVEPGNMFFSRGVIFSKSGNGTPFSRGVIFSKAGEGERPNEDVAIKNMISMDEAAFRSFADRLIRLKQAKVAGEVSGEEQ